MITVYHKNGNSMILNDVTARSFKGTVVGSKKQTCWRMSSVMHLDFEHPWERKFIYMMVE